MGTIYILYVDEDSCEDPADKYSVAVIKTETSLGYPSAITQCQAVLSV